MSPARPGAQRPVAERLSSARSRGIALLLCAVGSVLAWLAGGDQAGWVRPVALVALAGTGALLATGGVARRMVASLVTVAGVALLFAGGLPAPAGGVLVLAGGVLALVFSPTWPSMGARYERGTEPPTAGAAGAAENQPDSTRDVWDALDRGEDPTDGDAPDPGTAAR